MLHMLTVSTHFLMSCHPSPVLIGPVLCRSVGQWDCSYYDKVEELKDFGSNNKESLAELVWAFFEYWAWRHDYNNSVISVRTGGFLTKSQKEWTRRVGNERHLVCIEVHCSCGFQTQHSAAGFDRMSKPAWRACQLSRKLLPADTALRKGSVCYLACMLCHATAQPVLLWLLGVTSNSSDETRDVAG